MNVKAVKMSSHAELVPIAFQIKGMREVGAERFVLDVEGPLPYIDYSKIAESLKEQGVSDKLIDEAIEQMGDYIWTQSLALVLAARMVRE